MASRTTTDPIDILLEMGIDLDNLSEEEDYLSALKEAIAIILVKTKGAGNDKSKVLLDEVVKVRKSRKAADPKFKAKKTKISADSFKKGTATGTAPQSVGQKALPPAIKPKTSIIPYQKPDEVDDEEEGGKKKKARTRKKKDKDQNLLEGIAKSVSNIADILKKQYGLKKKKSSNDAKKAEAEQRKLKESGLEKRFKGLSKVAEKVIAPVKSVIDRILDFFLNIIVGRFLVKFIGWFGDPKNKKKVDSVVRFLTDHGPKLLAAFLLFGTGIGRFTVRLSALLIKGALRLGAAAAKFALGFARRHPAAAAITALVGSAALIGAMNKKDDAGSGGDAVGPGTESEDLAPQIDSAPAMRYGGVVPSYEEGGPVGGFIPNFFGMAKGAGSSVKQKGLGNAAMDFAGGALGGVKNFMDEKGISDVLMAHPLAKLGLLGFDKGKELLGGLTNFLNEKGIGDVLMQHPLAKMGSGFMNFGKDPARDITGESGQDVKGAGVDTQLISARPGDFVVNKKTADAMGPDYFDAISTNTGEKISGAGPDTQMIAARPGEIVVNRETVNALGPDHFLGLNRIFGGSGANKPKMAKVQSASDGGFVLPAFSTGGYVSGTDTGKRGTPDPNPVTPPNTGNGSNSGQKTPDIMGTLSRLIPAIGEKFSWAQKLIDPAFYGRSLTEAGKITGLNRLPGIAGEAQKMIQSTTMRVGSEAQKMIQPTIDYTGRVGSEAQKMIQPTIDRTMRAGGQVQSAVNEKVSSTMGGVESIVDTIKNQDYDGMMGSVKHMYGAAEEAVPALIGGILGNDRVDKHISKDMQKAILDAKKTAEARGSKNIDYGDYEGGGLSAGGLTMGRVGDQEFKRDAQGRIVGLTQTFDTNRPAEEAMLQAQISATRFIGRDNSGAVGKLNALIKKRMEGEGKSAEEIKKVMVEPGGDAGNMKDFARSIYKPMEALLDTVQGRGTTTHDVMFDKDVLGFDPVEAPPKPGSPNYQLFKDGGGMAALSKGKSVGQVVDSGRSANSTNPIRDFLGLSKPKSDKKPGETVGRDKLSPRAQKALARLDAQKAGTLTPDVKTSGPLLGRMSMGMMGGLNNMISNFTGGITNSINNPKSIVDSMGGTVKDGNIGTPTAQEQKDFDNLAAKKEKLRVTEAKLGTTNKNLVTPAPPPGGGNNVKVVRTPSPGGGGNNPNDNQTGGSDVDATSPGNGNKAKWSILGIPMPF